jgi:hypothetical protein
MSKTPESSGFCQKISASGDYGFVKNLDPVCKVCVWVSETGFFLGRWARVTVTFIHKQPLSLNVIGNIKVCIT